MGLPDAYARMSATDALDAKISTLDAKEMLQRADIVDVMQEVSELPKTAHASTNLEALSASGFSDKIESDRPLVGLPRAYATNMDDNKLEDTLVRADIRALQQRVASVDVAEEQAWATSLPEAYASIAADDKLEAVLARTDAQEVQERSAIAGMVNDSWAAGLPQAYNVIASDDQHDATLAKADACALQRRTDITESAPQATLIHNLPKAYAAMAADDGREDRLAHTDMKDVQACTDAADIQSPSWALVLSESYAAAAALDNLEAVLAFNDMRKLQRCTDTAKEHRWEAVLPAAYSELVEDEKFEAVFANADMCDLQCRCDAAEDITGQQLWAAGLPRAFEDAAENDKLEVSLARADTHFLQSCKDVEQSRKRMDSSSPSPRAPDLVDSCDEDAFDGNQWPLEQSPLKRQKTIGAFTRQESECSTAVPDGFERQFSAPESPAMAF